MEREVGGSKEMQESSERGGRERLDLFVMVASI